MTEGRTERIARYKKILRTIKLNTYRPDKPVMTEAILRTTCVAHGSLNIDEYSRHLRAAVENGDVVRGSGFVWVPGHTDAVKAIEYVTERTDEPQAFVSEVNRR